MSGVPIHRGLCMKYFVFISQTKEDSPVQNLGYALSTKNTPQPLLVDDDVKMALDLQTYLRLVNQVALVAVLIHFAFS